MDEPTWYLGPLGDVRPLPIPEPGVGVTLARFGGARQGLSGVRTLDITGVKYEYTFNFAALGADERMWLEALHTRLIPGPLRLIDPLRKNRLSVDAAACRDSATTNSGIVISSGTTNLELGWPVSGGFGSHHLVWTLRTANAALRFDNNRGTTVFAGEQITGSVFAWRNGGTFPLELLFEFYDATGAGPTVSGVTSTTGSTTPTRYSVTTTVPVGAVRVVLVVRSSTADGFRLAAPQIEAGSSATSWEPGGGAPVVVVDSLDEVSPRFPISDCSMTLLEA